MWFFQQNFSFGEVSEAILALSENQVHAQAMRKAQNVIVGKEFKPRKVWGTRFNHSVNFTGNAPCYFASFEIEKFGTVVLEIVNQNLRVIENGTLGALTFAVPYLTSELKDLWFIQANDRSNIGFLIHGKHMTRTIERRRDTTTPYAYGYVVEQMETDGTGPLLDERVKTLSLNVRGSTTPLDTIEADENFFNAEDANSSIFRVADHSSRWCRGVKFIDKRKIQVSQFDLAFATTNSDTGLSLNWNGPWVPGRNGDTTIIGNNITYAVGGAYLDLVTLTTGASVWLATDVGNIIDTDFTGSGVDRGPNTHLVLITKFDSVNQVKGILIAAPAAIANGTVRNGGRFLNIKERDTDNHFIGINKTQEPDAVTLVCNKPIFEPEMVDSVTPYIPTIHEPAARIHMSGGIIKVTQWDSPRIVQGIIEKSISDRFGSSTWGQTASESSGFASSGCFHQNRMALAGYERFGNRFSLSRSGDYRNFRLGANENASLSLGLVNNDANFIQWMISAGDLLIGSRQAEFAIKGVPLVPTNLGSDLQSTYGGSNVQPRQVGTAVLFASEDGRELREMIFRFDEDKYNAPNLGDHANHLFENSRIKQLAYMREPERIVWVLLDDGVLLAVSYNRDNGVVAWSPMTGRFVESISVARGTDGDQLWMCVKRTITPGGTKYYAEVMERTNKYMDSQVTEVPAAGVISNLTHLEGLKVEVLGDGIHLGEYTVVGGQITIRSETTVLSAVVGVKYELRVIPQVYEEFIPFKGKTSGKFRTVNQVKLKVRNTYGGQIKDDKTTVELVGLPRFPTAAKMDQAVPKFTGWVHHELVASDGVDPTYEIIHGTPHPFELLIAGTEMTSGTT